MSWKEAQHQKKRTLTIDPDAIDSKEEKNPVVYTVGIEKKRSGKEIEIRVESRSLEERIEDG